MRLSIGASPLQETLILADSRPVPVTNPDRHYSPCVFVRNDNR